MAEGAPKACEICRSDRIQIGCGYEEVSAWRRFWGVTFIYLPIFLFPFVIIIALLSWCSLRFLGAKNLKSYWDFVPSWDSHRYTFGNQIVMDPKGPLLHLGWKVFWVFNCKIYCPHSVALFDYMAYLVKAVENWWCPFEHARKSEYASAPLDASYWHVKPGEVHKLTEEDLKNPIFVDESVLVKIGKEEQPKD